MERSWKARQAMAGVNGDPRTLITRWYHEMWNQWRFDLVDEIVAPELVFRGSLGVESRGREALKAYMQLVRAAFPDFHNRVEQMIVEGSTVAARLTYTGTHLGGFHGIAATGRRIEYAGVAIFEVADSFIKKGWVLGDLYSLLRQLGPEQAR